MSLPADSLYTAFVNARDSLPTDHERRIRLAGVTSLRYDTITPDVVHLITPGEENPSFRRVIGNSLEEVASNLVLFPAHLVIYFADHPEITKASLEMSKSRREKEGILDIFRVDCSSKGSSTSTSLILLAKYRSGDIGVDSAQIQNALNMYCTKKTDHETYFISKTFDVLMKNLGESIAHWKETGSIGAIKLAFNPSFLEKGNRLLKESPTLKTSFDATLDRVMIQMSVLLMDPTFKDQIKAVLVPLLPPNMIEEELGLNRITSELLKDFMVNVLNVLFPGYWTPKQKMFDVINRELCRL